MKIKALAPFTAFDSSMIVFNKGDVREVSDKVSAYYIEHGIAEKVSKSTKETPIAGPVDEANEAFDPVGGAAVAEDADIDAADDDAPDGGADDADDEAPAA